MSRRQGLSRPGERAGLVAAWHSDKYLIKFNLWHLQLFLYAGYEPVRLDRGRRLGWSLATGSRTLYELTIHAPPSLTERA